MLEERIREYIKSCSVLQLASTKQSQPWVCTLIYVEDEKLNIYWASIPGRRHSKELGDNPKAAIAIKVDDHLNKGVVGIQAEGLVEVVHDPEEIMPIAKQYAQKFDRDDTWVKQFSNLQTEHKLYKFIPKKFVLFDEQSPSENSRQEFLLKP